jgi:NAD(P)-dependent dehydrogenase (short-subunit alcohol dehydrogenase family)
VFNSALCQLDAPRSYYLRYYYACTTSLHYVIRVYYRLPLSSLSYSVKQTVRDIQRQQPDAYLEAFQLDLASYKSINKFGTSLKQWLQETDSEPAIQLLINNAGMLAQSHRVTEDGLDE